MNVMVRIRTEHIDGWKTRMEVGTLTNTGYLQLSGGTD